MTLILRPPEKTDAQLSAIAASRWPVLAKNAAAEKSRRLHEQLRKEIDRG